MLRLWLLHNVLSQQGNPGTHDAEFRSLLWAATGSLGFCPDGIGHDDAGVWPIALHNWLVATQGKKPPERPNSFGTFAVGKQLRRIGLSDVLSKEELQTVRFVRTDCLAPYFALTQVERTQWLDRADRLSVALLMRGLLQLSLKTLDVELVQHRSAVKARIFDLDLAIADMQAQRARREAGVVATLGKTLGLSEPARMDLRDEVTKQWPRTSPQGVFLRETLAWSPAAWLALSADRRHALFSQAHGVAEDVDAKDDLVVGIVDALLGTQAPGRGVEVARFIGFLENTEANRARLFRDERGERLMALDDTTGFRERPVLALHRGVDFLGGGDREQALRSFAWAIGHSSESSADDVVHALARRWLSFALAQYETTPKVLGTLKALVPRRDFNQITEELAWRAALRADRVSFERATQNVITGSDLDARLVTLRALAEGNAGQMVTMLRDQAEEEPHAVMLFVGAFLDNLEKETADVRRAQVPTLNLLLDVLRSVQSGETSARSRTSKAAALLQRIEAVLDGLDALPNATALLSPEREPYGGSIRLAPVDTLPWPFAPSRADPPTAFLPLVLTAVEWRATTSTTTTASTSTSTTTASATSTTSAASAATTSSTTMTTPTSTPLAPAVPRDLVFGWTISE